MSAISTYRPIKKLLCANRGEIAIRVFRAATELGFKKPDDMFEKVGLGERLAPLVARHLLPADRSTTVGAPPAAPLAIAGTEGLVVSYARCCFPIPYDPIIAACVRSLSPNLERMFLTRPLTVSSVIES